MLSGKKRPYPEPILPPNTTRPYPSSPISISSDSSCSSYSVGSYDRFTDDETDRRYAADREDSDDSEDGLEDDQSLGSLEERRMRKAAVIAERKRSVAERLWSWPEAQRLERHVEIDVELIRTKRRNRRLRQENVGLWRRVEQLERRLKTDQFMQRFEDFEERLSRLQAQHQDELQHYQHRCEELQARLQQPPPTPPPQTLSPGSASRVLLQRLLAHPPSTPHSDPPPTSDAPTQASSTDLRGTPQPEEGDMPH